MTRICAKGQSSGQGCPGGGVALPYSLPPLDYFQKVQFLSGHCAPSTTFYGSLPQERASRGQLHQVFSLMAHTHTPIAKGSLLPHAPLTTQPPLPSLPPPNAQVLPSLQGQPLPGSLPVHKPHPAGSAVTMDPTAKGHLGVLPYLCPAAGSKQDMEQSPEA
jgi:hypothetical protein